MNETCKLDMESPTTGNYHVTFLSRRPSDSHLCDDTSRWWPLWYEYVLDTNNIPVYGARILLGPNRKPNINFFILWTYFVHFFYPSCYIHGPFDFDSRSNIIKINQYITFPNWELLLTSCSTLSIVSPILSNLTVPTTSPVLKRKWH